MKEIKAEDLMSYLYNEASPEMNDAIKKAIAEDQSLKYQLNLLQLSMQQLDKLDLKSPSNASLMAIMAYASKKNSE
jgi:hypothetical protein